MKYVVGSGAGLAAGLAFAFVWLVRPAMRAAKGGHYKLIPRRMESFEYWPTNVRKSA